MQTLTISNTGDDDLDWTIDEVSGSAMVQILQPAGRHEVDARQAPAIIGRSAPTYIASPSAILLDEGFEGGVVPPTDWTQEIQNAGFTWKSHTFAPHTGSFAADVEYDPALSPQDEWLLSPEMDIFEGTLSFWSSGSLFWCRDDNDNCDLDVWLVVGAVGGGDDVYVGQADPDWPASFTWAQSTFDLTPLLPGGPVRVGFQYTGVDGAQVSLDDILVDGTAEPGICDVPSDIPWLSVSPASGTTSGLSSTDVEITFDSTGLAIGVYTGTLCINSNDTLNPLITIPVEMEVTEPIVTDYIIYLPIIKKQ
jgi:hypothetical protein